MPLLASLQAPRRIFNDLRLSRHSDILEVDLRANVGFFAQLNWCLYILAYCDDHNLDSRIRLIGPQYSSASNHDWFHDFFSEIHTDANGGITHGRSEGGRVVKVSIQHINETRFAVEYAPTMTIERAYQLFTMHYKINTQIQTYVNRFATRELSDGKTIGLHYRGTDKYTEAAPVAWQQCLQSVMKYASDHREVKNVFLSSDDARFVDWFSENAKGILRVVSHPDEERSRDAMPVHGHLNENGYRKGFEALVNCLLLSRCAALIRTASFLSGWSSIFNPLLPITMLNAPYADACWFPDRELIRRSDNRYR